jgi:hypothetical protein
LWTLRDETARSANHGPELHAGLPGKVAEKRVCVKRLKPNRFGHVQIR